MFVIVCLLLQKYVFFLYIVPFAVPKDAFRRDKGAFLYGRSVSPKTK